MTDYEKAVAFSFIAEQDARIAYLAHKNDGDEPLTDAEVDELLELMEAVACNPFVAKMLQKK